MNPTDQVKRLEEELYDARRAILRQAPEDLQNLLGRYGADDWDPLGWLNEVVRAVLSAAPAATDRVICPLCRSPGMSSSGFTLPTGLRRHLVGQGTTEQCDVVFAAMRLARDYCAWRTREKEEHEKEKLAASKPPRRTGRRRHKQPATADRVTQRPVVVLVRTLRSERRDEAPQIRKLRRVA